MRKILSLALALLLTFALTSCGSETQNGSNSKKETTAKSIKVDYENEVVFEKALNDGIDVTGKTVKFTADELHPDSLVGYNIWSGEHLNFVSESDPGIKQGQVVTAKILKYTTEMGSWYLSYEVLDTSSASGSKSEKQDLVLKDSGYTIVQGSYSTNIYYAVVIENPNADYAIEFPKINIVCKSETGAILKSEEQVLNYIAAGDTLTYGNSFSCDEGKPSTVEVTISNNKDNIELHSDSKYVKSSAFEIGNVSFFNDGMKATAEVKNTTSKDMDQIAVSVVFSQGGHVIGGYTGYVDDVSAGATKAAEINSYGSGTLKYDTVKLYACEW